MKYMQAIEASGTLEDLVIGPIAVAIIDTKRSFGFDGTHLSNRKKTPP